MRLAGGLAAIPTHAWEGATISAPPYGALVVTLGIPTTVPSSGAHTTPLYTKDRGALHVPQGVFAFIQSPTIPTHGVCAVLYTR